MHQGQGIWNMGNDRDRRCPRCGESMCAQSAAGDEDTAQCEHCGHRMSVSGEDLIWSTMSIQDVKQRWDDQLDSDITPGMTIKEQKPDICPTSGVNIYSKSVAVEGEAFDPPAEYELKDPLGEGGMGLVYAARQNSVNRTIALKILRQEIAKDPAKRNQFLSEAAVTGELDHPNIVPIHELGSDDEDNLFYAMKKVEGSSWQNSIDDLSVEENLEILMDVCDAVAFAHSKNIIHRDLKPQNVMVGEFGEVLVMDWGLAASVGEEGKAPKLEGEVHTAGTPAYMPPEMARGDGGRTGCHSDQYLLGAILFRIVTGQLPRSADTASACICKAAGNEIAETDKTGELMDIAHRAMSTRPEDRYEGVEEFQQAIREYQFHMESVTLTRRAQKQLAEAEESGDYDDYARAIYGFEEALELWAENGEAQKGAREAPALYARHALENGDLDLASSLVDANDPQHAELTEEITSARNGRATRHRRLKSFKYGICLLAAVVMAVLAVGFFWIRSERTQAVAQRRRAEKALREVEDAYDISKLYNGLGPVNATTLAQHVDNLLALQDFIPANQDNVQLSEVTERRDREARKFVEMIMSDINEGNAKPVATAFRKVSGFRDVLMLLEKEYPDVIPAIRSVLQATVSLPVPEGRAQFTRDAIEMLKWVDPDSKIGRAAERIMQKRRNKMDVLMDQDFQQYAVGDHPDDWAQMYSVEVNEVRGKRKALLVDSTYGNAGVCKNMVDVKGEVAILEADIKLEPGEEKDDGPLEGEFGFGGKKYVCRLAMRESYFGLIRRGENGQRVFKKKLRITPGEWNHVCLRYFPERGTFDVRVNGLFLGEEVPVENAQEVRSVNVVSISGTRTFVDNVTLRCSDRKMKRALGDFWPVIAEQKIPLQVARLVEVSARGLTVADVNGDDHPEMVIGGETTEGEGKLKFVQLHGRWFRPKLVGVQKFKSDFSLSPATMVGPYIGVFGFGEHVHRANGKNTRHGGFALIEVQKDFSASKVFSRKYPRTIRGCMTSLEFADGTAGLAVGTKCYWRGLEVFRWDQNKNSFHSVARERPGDSEASDIRSIVAHDWDGDGGDDLFVGWGPWNGFGPVVIALEDKRPSMPRRLTDGWVGRTRVDCSPLGTDTSHLLVVSTRGRDSGGDLIDGYGLRIYRLKKKRAELICHREINACRVATGRIAGREVFAVARREQHEGGRKSWTKSLDVYELQNNRPRLLWRTRFRRDRLAPKKLVFADANGDGVEELLVSFGDEGILIVSDASNRKLLPVNNMVGNEGR